MSRISSSVGIITGVPIEETVNKLLGIAAKPRDLLKTRNDGLKSQQAALDTLGSRLLAFQFSVNRLKTPTNFQSQEASSSNEDALAVSIPTGKTATAGTYQVRPVRAASSQQVVSQAFESDNELPVDGTLSFRVGGHVDKPIELAQLNGGAGVQRGKIRLTDRSGVSEIVDLSYARTVDDVLEAINGVSDVAIRAEVVGDSFQLVDSSGGAGSLRVQEVGGGKTALGLGLAAVNVAADEATGVDILRLHAGTKLTALRDGLGVEITGEGVADLSVTLRDGSQLGIDLHDATTLGDVVDQINAASPTKLTAEIAADGRRLKLSDLTTGSSAFAVVDAAASSAATELGLTVDSSAGVINGNRLIAGLRDTLLASLNGGAGLGPLGELGLEDRNGAVDVVDLAGAETLGDVIAAVNASEVSLVADFNAARNGLVLTDFSGGTGDLFVTNEDATNTADLLQLAVSGAVDAQDSGSLGRQTLSRATLLSSLNGGQGVTLGDLKITDSSGRSQTVDVDTKDAEAKTVGDLIDRINLLTIGVEARLNDAGDGIVLVDTAGGAGSLTLTEVKGDLAHALNLHRGSRTVEIDGEDVQIIDGSPVSSVDLENLDADGASVLLSSLNGGKGLTLGDVKITDSKGRSIALDLNGADAGVTTVDELVALINRKGAERSGGFGVAASLNSAGTGILLEDTALGAAKLTVEDVSGAAAAQLRLAGEGKKSGAKQTIDGAGAFSVDTRSTGLNALAARINELDAGVAAEVFFDGQGYRLALNVEAAGAANELLVELSGSGLQFEETAAAQDALLLYGNVSDPGAGVLVSSGDGAFDDAFAGLNLAVKQGSDEPVTVSVVQTDTSLVESFQQVVDSYNALRGDLAKLTAFDSESATTGLLFGTNEALQIDSRLSFALTNRYFGAGDLTSLEQLGLSVNDQGELELNTSKLRDAFEEDPVTVEKFLTDPTSGVAVKLAAEIDRLAGTDDSLLAARSDALQDSIAANEARLTRYQEQLDRQQERLYLQFYQLESIIANLQSNLSTIQQIQPISPL